MMGKKQLGIRYAGCGIIISALFLFIGCDNPLATDILPPRDQAGALVSKPVIVGLPDPESVTVGRVNLLSSSNQVVEYAISTVSNTDPGSLAWQTLTTFHGLSSGTAYYVYARSAENPRYNAGEYSMSDLIRFYTVYFIANDATGGTPPDSQTVLEDTWITLPDWGTLTKTASAFGSWNTQENLNGIDYIPGRFYQVTHDQNMYAKWLAAQTYTFPYEPPTGGGNINTGIIISQTAAHPYPAYADLNVPDGYDSVQWIYGAEPLGTGFTLRIDAAHILYNVPGLHIMTIIVYKGGVPYNYNLTFTVVE